MSCHPTPCCSLADYNVVPGEGLSWHELAAMDGATLPTLLPGHVLYVAVGQLQGHQVRSGFRVRGLGFEKSRAHAGGGGGTASGAFRV